jgi:hypothetical protein
MVVVRGYTQSVLGPQLRSLGLGERQREIVAEDVARRLESVLSHWSDVPFRRAILVLGTEEASFWEPRSAGLEIRSLVVVAVRNSLITDLNASRAFTEPLRSPKELLPDGRMPWITSEAIKYFDSVDLDAVQIHPKEDVFGSLSRRFPNAWHVLSLLGGSSESEIACELPMAEAEPLEISTSKRRVEHRVVVDSGIDPSLDDHLVDILRLIELRELDLFVTLSFKHITRNPEKLLAILDHVLRYGGTILTPNYLLSPTYLARRNPLLRPAHYASEFEAKITDREGLSEPHKELLASLTSEPTTQS